MHTESGAPQQRPYVLLSCAMSIDGCLDAPGPRRLILSGDADLDRVDAERAEADAIMVGAATIRRDNPGLLIRSPVRRAARIARDLPEHPVRVTLTASGDLDPGARFFAPAGAGAVVYCAAPQAPQLQLLLNELAQVIAVPPPVGLVAVLGDLARRGVRRLLVEGGARLGREFLAAGLVDELALAVAPFFVGAAAAPRFAGPAAYPHDPGWPMRLAEVRQLDEVVLLRYLLGGVGPGVRGEAWVRPDHDNPDPEARGARGGPEAQDRDPDAEDARGGLAARDRDPEDARGGLAARGWGLGAEGPPGGPVARGRGPGAEGPPGAPAARDRGPGAEGPPGGPAARDLTARDPEAGRIRGGP